jgi:hypothetical protein
MSVMDRGYTCVYQREGGISCYVYQRYGCEEQQW